MLQCWRHSLSKSWKHVRYAHTSLSQNFVNDIKSENLEVYYSKNLKEKPSGDTLPFAKIMSDHMLYIEWFKGYGWSSPTIKQHLPILMHPCVGALQYGGQIYEGMKAYYGPDGRIRMFRPELNMNRFWKSAQRMSLPIFDEQELLNCIYELVRIEQDWIPKKEGNSLYIRPTLISMDPTSGDNDINRALLFVLTSPSGPYFPGGKMRPISLLANPDHVRSWIGGIGEVKAGGNYGPTLYMQRDAMTKGCDQVLWLYENKVTEAGGMNIFMHWMNEQGEEELLTAPLDTLILPGITRQSCLELAKEWGDVLVTEKDFTIQDVVKASRENRIKHIFACGTAAVICPVERILYEHGNGYEELAIPYDMSNQSLMMKLYNKLLSIQFGDEPHHWSRLVI